MESEDAELLAQPEAEHVTLESLRRDLLRQVAEADLKLRQNRIKNAQFAPVYKLPDDVLKLIFEEAYQHLPLPSGRVCTSDCDASTATQVSRRWRAIALALPSIWACIHVALHDDLRRLWLDRSCSVLLSIIHDIDTPLTQEQRGLLLQHAPRFKHCTMYTSQLPLNFPTPFLNLKSILIGHMTVDAQYLLELSTTSPQLAELTFDAVQMIYHGEEQFNDETVSAFAFPSLKTLCFILTAFEGILCHIEAPSLQNLICNSGPLSHSAPSLQLRTYPSMTHMRLETCASDMVEINDGDIFRLAPGLTSLEFIGCINLAPMFRCLVAFSDRTHPLLPCLQTVTLTDILDESFDLVKELVLRRSRLPSPMRELKLGERSAHAMGDQRLNIIREKVAVSIFPEQEEEEENARGEYMRRQTSRRTQGRGI